MSHVRKITTNAAVAVSVAVFAVVVTAPAAKSIIVAGKMRHDTGASVAVLKTRHDTNLVAGKMRHDTNLQTFAVLKTRH